MRYLIIIDDPQNSMNPDYLQSGRFIKDLQHRLSDAVFVKVVTLPNPEQQDESVLDA